MRVLLLLEVVMKLLRWLAYCLAGYLAYQFCEGMLAGVTSRRRRQRQSRASDLDRALNDEEGRFGALTGPGVGRDEYVEEPSSGAAMRERVGRGVVRR